MILRLTVSGLVVFFVVYVILKAINEYVYSQQPVPVQPKKKKRIDVEIVSRDLYVKAENIINKVDIYTSQAYRIMKEIDKIQEKIKLEQASAIRSDDLIDELVNTSLKLQEKQASIESKIIKLNSELDTIALEELRRQS